MTTFSPTAATSRDLRNAFGCFATGVTVITTQTPEGPLGMTANSFSSVSLEPPLVLWSPAKASRRHDTFADARHFCIHVLGADQADLAHHFATQGHDFGAFNWDSGPNGAPTIMGCLATFHCATHAIHPAGDHSVILGLVEYASVTDDSAPALLFERGQLRALPANP